MGKALLIMVLGSSLILAKQYFSNQNTERESRQDQVSYEEEVLAREIARSAFNFAMGMARENPNALDAAVTAIHSADGVANGAAGADTMYAGTARGGQFRVEAVAQTGHTLRVTATGFYGGSFNTAGRYVKRLPNGREVPAATYTMSDSYRIRVLQVREDGELNTSFLSSVAGYCSAVFMQEFRDEQLLSTRMVFTAGHNRDGATPTSRFYVQAGTQLNFFIGVDQNCSTEPASSATACTIRTTMFNYTFNASQYNSDGVRRQSSYDYEYVHNALDVPVQALDRAEESPWALVEQHPSDRQRWRIAWEDIHTTSWNNPTGNDPRSSLQALKRQGYDTNNDGRGEGWATRDGNGYRRLIEGNLDVNDQAIQVSMSPFANDAARESLRQAMLTERQTCGITSNVGLPPASSSTTCPCSTTNLNNGRIGILHRAAGSTAARTPQCVTSTDWNSSHKNHDDLVVCRGGSGGS